MRTIPGKNVPAGAGNGQSRVAVEATQDWTKLSASMEDQAFVGCVEYDFEALEEPSADIAAESRRSGIAGGVHVGETHVGPLDNDVA